MSTVWKDDAVEVELDIARKTPSAEYPISHLLYRPSALGCGLEVV
jgi:hypothetical protein